MNQELVLRVMSTIMGWDDDDPLAMTEFRWLRLMSRFKYDGYRDFVAGVRFIESLANWIQQFDGEQERSTAYEWVKERLVYIGPAEMRKLVELLYPVHVHNRLIKAVASEHHVPPHRIFVEPIAELALKRLRRETLFLALSDGARLDVFRRANSLISNEQVVSTTQLDDDKWEDLAANLRNDTEDEHARFRFVYLIDDFTASGLSLLREKDGQWKGKLPKFWASIGRNADKLLHTDWTLCIHHHLATHAAVQGIHRRAARAREARQDDWPPRIEFTYGYELPGNFSIGNTGIDADFRRLTEKYYDSGIETDHTWVGGTDLKLGFAGGGLPLILEHNTPNNSVALLWAESNGNDHAPPMRPLFRRRQRHS